MVVRALYVLVFFATFFFLTAFSNADPIAITHDDWRQAHQSKIEATLQVSFPTTIFEKDTNIFSYVLSELPRYFSHLKLNTIGRELHSTLLYLGGLTFNEAQRIARFLAELDIKTLERFDLTREVQVFDPENVGLIVVGTNSQFIALKPHRDFVEWQLRFYRLLQEKAPWLLKGAKLDPDKIHLSLVQFGKRVGLPLTNEEQQAVLKKLKELIQAGIAKHVERNGHPPKAFFSLSTHPIALVTPPLSIKSPPSSIFTFKLNGGVSFSRVGRWQIDDAQTKTRRLIEFDIQRWLVNDVQPFAEVDEVNPFTQSQHHQKLDDDTFLKMLPPVLRGSYQRASKTLSPTLYPSLIPAFKPHQRERFFSTAQTHPMLERGKGIPILEVTRGLDIHSTNDISIGTSIYASAVRKDIQYPGDWDVLMNALVHVPQHIKTRQEAEAFAIKKFTQQILVDQLIRTAKNGKTAITEMRLGSDATMGLNSSDIVKALEQNPYLSEQDMINGFYVDARGRKWTLEELVAVGDFMKGKVDLFRHSGRKEISLQFTLGYEWYDPETKRYSVQVIQRDGLKGQAPLLRTADYDGAGSFAIAAILYRAHAYYAIQKGSFLGRAIHDIMRSSVLSSKTTKRIYNFLLLLSQNELSLDRYFFNQTLMVLRRQYDVSEYSFAKIFNELQGAINQPALKQLNTIRRIVNDMSEYNDRGWLFRQDQWFYRAAELARHLAHFNELIHSQAIVVQPSLMNSFRRFQFAFNYILQQAAEPLEELRHKRWNKVFHEFESELAILESQIIKASLSEKTQRWIGIFVTYLPVFYFKYLKDRSQDSDSKLYWTLKFMGIEPTNENVTTMEKLSEQMDDLTTEEVVRLQNKMYQTPSHAPSDYCARALSTNS